MKNHKLKSLSLPGLGMLLAGLLIAVSLSGCIGNTPPPADYYLISDDALLEKPGGKLPGESLAIEIRAVRLPPYLERKAIVTREGPNQLHFSDQHRWGGKLHRNLARVMASQLSRMLDGAQVAVSPRSLPVKPRLLLEVELVEFERQADGRVTLQANWRLVDALNLQPRSGGTEQLASDALANPKDYPAIVATMSRLFGQLSQRLAQAIADAATT